MNAPGAQQHHSQSPASCCTINFAALLQSNLHTQEIEWASTTSSRISHFSSSCSATVSRVTHAQNNVLEISMNTKKIQVHPCTTFETQTQANVSHCWALHHLLKVLDVKRGHLFFLHKLQCLELCPGDFTARNNFKGRNNQHACFSFPATSPQVIDCSTSLSSYQALSRTQHSILIEYKHPPSQSWYHLTSQVLLLEFTFTTNLPLIHHTHLNRPNWLLYCFLPHIYFKICIQVSVNNTHLDSIAKST